MIKRLLAYFKKAPHRILLYGLSAIAMVTLICILSIRPAGFTVGKITSFHSSNPKWDVGSLTTIEKNLTDEILHQPFTYLASGNHCYVFVSDDDQYVIKFFKQKHMRTNIWENYLPLPNKLNTHRMAKLKKRIKLRNKTYGSYRLAYNHLKKETGLIFLHLNKSKYLNSIITLIDQKGHKHKLYIDNFEFLIQKKAEVGFDRLSVLIESYQIESAFNLIESLYNIIITRSQKGFSDADMQIYKNFGFVEKRAIEIDIDKLKVDPDAKENCKNDLIYISNQLDDWMSTYYPHLIDQLYFLTTQALASL